MEGYSIWKEHEFLILLHILQINNQKYFSVCGSTFNADHVIGIVMLFCNVFISLNFIDVTE